MINILTDSTADISKDLCAAYNIDTIPMYIQVNGKVYKDGDDINPEMLFDEVKRSGRYPTTSAPAPSDFIKFFLRKDPCIYIGVSSALSTTFRNAQLALKELSGNSVDLIDSRSFSTGYGQVVLQAAKWRNEGVGFEELGRRLRALIQKTRGIFILDTLDYLYHGGRCSAIEHFVSSVLDIHPLLNVLPNGTLGILKKVRGSRIKAVNQLFAYFKNQLDKFEVKSMILTHLGCETEVNHLIEKITELGSPINVSVARVGCVLATHSGPKPIGIAYTVE